MTEVYPAFSLVNDAKTVDMCKAHDGRCNKKTLQRLDELLETFHVDAHIKHDARHICSTFLNTDIPRKNRSHQLLVACLYIALKRGRSLLHFEKVCEHAQMNPQHVRRMVKKVYDYCPNFLTSSVDVDEEKTTHLVLTPSSSKHVLESMVHLICEKEDVIKNNEFVKKRIMCVLHDILSTSNGYLHDYQTSHLAIAIVVLCVSQNGILMNKTEFARKYGTSHATLHKYIILLNSVQKT